MAHTAVVTFTAENLDTILSQGGSQAWRLDLDRARRSEYLVCVQNRRHADFHEPGAAHGTAFLVGRISAVVPSPKRPDRWLIRISHFTECDIPDIWNQRYPVAYTTLEELGCDPGDLPPFRPVPTSASSTGFGELATAPVMTPANWMPKSTTAGGRLASPRPASDQDTWRRLDAILDQIDRIPDLPAPFDPLAWDEHGLPR